MQSNRLAEWRHLYEIDATALARAAGIHRVTLHRIERGLEEPSVSKAIRLCQALEQLGDETLERLGAEAHRARTGVRIEAYVSVEDVFTDADGRQALGWAAENWAALKAGGPQPDEPDPFLPATPFRYWLINRSESDREMAEQLGVDAQRVGAIRNGKRKKVRQSVVDRAGVLQDLYP